MHVYVLRHGIAEDAKSGESDSNRALTPEGRKKLSSVLERAESAGVAPSVILTSPYLRAKQTARMAAQAFDREDAVIETSALVPSGSPELVWDEISEYRAEAQVMVVGHEPLLSELVSYLLDSPSLRIEMRKAAMVAISIESLRGGPRGVLQWMLTPKLASS
jgi:phosphohistidine phosphatase